jgi:hypothetical protein
MWGRVRSCGIVRGWVGMRAWGTARGKNAVWVVWDRVGTYEDGSESACSCGIVRARVWKGRSLSLSHTNTHTHTHTHTPLVPTRLTIQRH